MNLSRSKLAAYKLFFGLLGFSAIVTEISTIVDRGRFNAGNFFSYFTIESNILISAIFILSAFALYAGNKAKIDFIRGAATLYIVLVGIGFALLLSGIEGAEFTAVAWDNIVLHYFVPIAALIDWLIDPPTKKVPFRRALVWLSVPAAYVAYTLIRGPIADWYPYPFIDPRENGYVTVAVTCFIVAILTTVFVFVLSKVHRSADRNFLQGLRP